MNKTKPHILVVDDDRSILKFITANLKTRGYEIFTAFNGAEAIEIWQTEPVDLILLDLVMPEMDGLAVCQFVRQFSTVPIIVLSALDDEDRKVKALDLGADDYLTKPFGLQELLARVRAVLRRAAQTPARHTDASLLPPQQYGNLRVDFSTHQIYINDENIHLTPLEFALLKELLQHAGKLLTHNMLLTWVWGPEYQDNSQYLHIYISRLRQKLVGATGIEIITEPGIGYILSMD